MTKEEFKNLDAGDVVRIKGTNTVFIIVESNERGMHKIASRKIHLRIPENYDLVSKEPK